MEVKVWINGCFDVLHIGHINLIEFGKTEEIFRNPKKERTQNYITGRFG